VDSDADDGKEDVEGADDVDNQEEQTPEQPAEAAPKASLMKRASQSFAENTYKQDLHKQSMEENAGAKEIWDKAELYDENAEMMFTYVQVFTACLNSFAHGGESYKPFLLLTI
jgi:hypothetical protein